MADETGLVTNPAMRCDAALAENLSATSQSGRRSSPTMTQRSAPVTVDAALERVRTSTPRLSTETVEAASALGRVLAAPAAAAHPLPPFDQSAVDGYAVRRFDLAASSTTLPVMSVVAAGPHEAPPELAAGTAARIFTGGLLPRGADTIVRQELTTSDGATVTIREPVPVGADLRRRGEELGAGDIVGPAGSQVTAGLIGALTMAGATTLTVARRPRVRALVTGDEVVPAGSPLGLGQIRDSNGPMVRATLARWGSDTVEVDHLPDRPDVIERALRDCLDTTDVIVTTGGVSVGHYDFIPAVAEAIGFERVLWGVTQRPGAPLYVARRDDVLLFGLPGNPAAVLTNLHVYVRLALDAMAGLDPSARWRPGVSPHGVRQLDDRTLWLRCRATTDEHGTVRFTTLRHQGSHMLSNLALANALARVPPYGSADDQQPPVLSWLDLDAP